MGERVCERKLNAIYYRDHARAHTHTHTHSENGFDPTQLIITMGQGDARDRVFCYLTKLFRFRITKTCLFKYSENFTTKKM